MKRDEILNMPAGREMDVLIAEHVMGWVWFSFGSASVLRHPEKFIYGVIIDGKERRYYDGLPRYSENMGDAWEVVERLRELYYRIFLSYARNIVTITLDHDNYQKDMDFWIEAETAPLAICRAALLVKIENE